METASLIHTVGRSRIAVSYTDIITVPVDVIVSSDDVLLSMSGGVSRAIRMGGGEVIYEEAQRSKPIPLGSVAVTSAGALPLKFVFHAAVLDKSLEGRGVSEAVVRQAVRACFRECAPRNARSIAFPALATGTARLSPEQSASAILMETFAYLETEPALEEVHLVLHTQGDDAVQKRFYLKAQQYFALKETASQIDRAVYQYQQFAASPSPSVTSESLGLIRARDTLNASMVAAPASEFSENVAPQLRQGLRDDVEKLQSQFGADPNDRTNVRLRAEIVGLLYHQAVRERQRLELEDTLNGGTTEERQRQKEFLQKQEEKFSSELTILERSTRPVVISIHGIRTRGAWQKEITPALNYAGFTHVPLDYGRFGLLRFLWRPSRQKQVDAFREAYREHGARCASGHPSVIAHSLGSYIVAEAIAKYNLRFDQLLLCGAIVQRDYDWATAHAANFVKRVLNDCGSLDIWARLAERVLLDAGQSGLHGFTNTAGGKVINRNHALFGHSDYFYEQNYTESWVPFLLGGDPAPLVNLGATKTNRAFWLTIAAVVAAGALLFLLARG